MMSRRTTFLAALTAAALTASAAGAAGAHTPSPTAGDPPATRHGQTMPHATTGGPAGDLPPGVELTPGGTPALWLHGVLGCAPSAARLTCRQMQRLLAK
ncbi:MAG: hypothetical protein P8Y53_10515 [Pseudolabrys sp.]|jgi:hypothetical protein